MSDPVAIHARGVERKFGSMRVLRGLDLTVRASKSLVLFGPNGAGKTTLLRLLAGLASPQRGSIAVFGTPLPGDVGLRKRIGLVAHDSLLYGNLSATENLQHYARLYKIAERGRIEMLVARVGLERNADRPVHVFSRGMIQRLAVARALLHRPDLLLLDEPFTGLDPDGRALLASLLTEERNRGVTLVTTTHDFEQGLAVADSAAVLNAGKVAWHSEGELPAPDAMGAIYTNATKPH